MDQITRRADPFLFTGILVCFGLVSWFARTIDAAAFDRRALGHRDPAAAGVGDAFAAAGFCPVLSDFFRHEISVRCVAYSPQIRRRRPIGISAELFNLRWV